MRSCEAVATKRETAPKESTMIQVGSKRIAYMQMKHLFLQHQRKHPQAETPIAERAKSRRIRKTSFLPSSISLSSGSSSSYLRMSESVMRNAKMIMTPPAMIPRPDNPMIIFLAMGQHMLKFFY